MLDEFSEMNNESFKHKPIIENNLLEEYINKFQTEKGILLKEFYMEL